MPNAGEAVVAHGFAELEVFTRDWLAQWRNYRIVGENFEEVGADKVFVSVRQIATGRQSGVDVGFSVWTIRGGKVVKLSSTTTGTNALQAAGLAR